MLLKTQVYDIAKDRIKQNIVELQGLGLNCEEVLLITENAVHEIRAIYDRQMLEQEIEKIKPKEESDPVN